MANYSGLWDGVGGTAYTFNKRQHSPNNYHLARILKRRNMRELSEHITNLITDATPATTSSVSYTRIAHTADTTSNVLGGVATLETHQLVGGDDELFGGAFGASGAKTSRAVTANDGTDIQQYLEGGDAASRQPTDGSATVTYIEDSSGNGGGGKHSTGS
jgi:hypothetical protein